MALAQPQRALFTLTPDRGPCGVPVTARGAGFPPGSTVNIRGPFYGASLGTTRSVPQPTTTVGTDGTFGLSMLPCTDQTDYAHTPGFVYTWSAETTPPLLIGATTTFTVQPALPGLPNTGGGAMQGRAALPAGLLVAWGFLAGLGGVALYASAGRRRSLG